MRTSYPPFTARSTLPSTGKTGVERVFELPRGGGAKRQPAGERQPSRGRHDRRLNAVADGDFEMPSSSFSSAMSITASLLPPTSTNATSAPIATMVPSMV